MSATDPWVVRALTGFDDPTFGRRQWNGLQAGRTGDGVFLTWEWQSAWWSVLGRGTLRLLVAEREGQVLALAPLFTESGMVYFVGSGAADYLDFVGDVGMPGVMEALLAAACAAVPGFIGFVFYHVPEASPTGALLAQAAERLGMAWFDEGGMPAPVLELPDPEAVLRAAGRKSLVRHERFLERHGSLAVVHGRRREEIEPHLDAFFAQHRERWQETPHPSLFHDPAQPRFYRALTAAGDGAGWLRFTRVEWQGRPIAFHFGFCHRGRYLWYKPSFAVDLARRSPGEVLLRRLLLAAGEEGAHTFDFGLGDEPFKARFATRVDRVRNWGLYDRRALGTHERPGG